jgi:transposase
MEESPIATEAVERIAPLYEIEEEIRGRSPDERQSVSNAKSRPLLKSMGEWLETSLSKLAYVSSASFNFLTLRNPVPIHRS